MGRMTKSRALARARIELGPTAWVESTPGSDLGRYRVGTVDERLLGIRRVRGHGDTWEAALDQANRDRNGIRLPLLREEIEALLAGGPLYAATVDELRRGLKLVLGRLVLPAVRVAARVVRRGHEDVAAGTPDVDGPVVDLGSVANARVRGKKKVPATAPGDSRRPLR